METAENSKNPAKQEGQVDELVRRIGAVLTYVDRGTRRACGQTIGADGAGTYSVIFTGAAGDASLAARKYIRDIDGREPGRVTNICIVANEECYFGLPIKVIDLDA